jgi:hypothetical protein
MNRNFGTFPAWVSTITQGGIIPFPIGLFIEGFVSWLAKLVAPPKLRNKSLLSQLSTEKVVNFKRSWDFKFLDFALFYFSKEDNKTLKLL